MNILVTGGAGFIGSHVVDALLAVGHAVRVMDNLGPPTHDGAVPPWLDARAEFVRGDVRNKPDWERMLSGIDAVIHLASYMDYHLDFSTYIRSNTESVALLFECIVDKKLPVKKIVAASSQAVYGMGQGRCAAHGAVANPVRSEEDLKAGKWEHYCPTCRVVLEPMLQREDDRLAPEIPYGISKYAAELLLRTLGKRYGVPTTSLRFSIALGPRQSFRHFYSGALRSFAVNALSGDPIQMNEDGGQRRDFVDVRDVAAAHLLVLNDPRADFEVYNVGSGRPTDINTLAETVARAGRVPFTPLRKGTFRVGDNRASQMDVSKLRALGWEPQTPLETSVKDYLDWVRQFGGLKETLQKTYDELSAQGIMKGA